MPNLLKVLFENYVFSTVIIIIIVGVVVSVSACRLVFFLAFKIDDLDISLC